MPKCKADLTSLTLHQVHITSSSSSHSFLIGRLNFCAKSASQRQRCCCCLSGLNVFRSIGPPTIGAEEEPWDVICAPGSRTSLHGRCVAARVRWCSAPPWYWIYWIGWTFHLSSRSVIWRRTKREKLGIQDRRSRAVSIVRSVRAPFGKWRSTDLVRKWYTQVVRRDIAGQ